MGLDQFEPFVGTQYLSANDILIAGDFMNDPNMKLQ